jgi:hypothetical protein
VPHAVPGRAEPAAGEALGGVAHDDQQVVRLGLGFEPLAGGRLQLEAGARLVHQRHELEVAVRRNPVVPCARPPL